MKCTFENCEVISSSYGYDKNKPSRCFKHKLPDMINVKHRRCAEQNCNIISPNFGYIKGEPTHCLTHKLEKMIDVVHKKCKSCNLFRAKDLCSYCNPSKIGAKKEKIVYDLLIQNNYSFTYNKQINNECCIKNRPDFLFDCGTHFVILECDENAHCHYEKECEIIRMNNISTGLGLPTRWIRYNPDLSFVSTKDKHKKLLETLDDFMISPDGEMIIYLFYN